MANKYLDNDGVLYLWNKIKSLVSGAVPTKTSDLTNDSGFITSADVPEGATASTSTPLMDGTAAVGTSTAFARGDHVHPSDTTKVDKVSGYGLIKGEAPSKPVDLAYLTAMGLTANDAEKIIFRYGDNTAEDGFITIEGMATLVQALGNQLSAKANTADVVSNTAFNTAMQQANVALSNKADKSDITNMYKYKGSVATVSALPSSDNTTGDVYNVEASGMNYAWDGQAWDALGEIFTITAITNSELDTICV